MRVFLGLGANEGNPRLAIEAALPELSQRGAALVRASSLYETEPVGGPPQPWFVNAVVEVRFDGEPRELLQKCQEVESLHGRDRTVEFGPRTLDIDLLLFGETILRTPELTIPHPRLAERRFVLVPLVEIAPDLRDPLSGLTMKVLLSRCMDLSGVVLLSRMEGLPSGT